MRWIFCLAALSIGSVVLAQDTQPTDQSSAPTTQPSVVPADQLLTQMLRPQEEKTKPIQPVAGPPAADATSGDGALAPGAPTVSLLREGTDIVERVGHLRKTQGDLPEFVFDSDGRALTDPPMLVLPNLKLMQMETAMGTATDNLHFRVTGTVTEYRGRNYILLDKVVVVSDKMVDN
jgi:hypothetical protein